MNSKVCDIVVATLLITVFMLMMADYFKPGGGFDTEFKPIATERK